MLASDVLERLSAYGVRLEREGAALVAMPKAALTDELRALIRDHKPALLDALAGAPAAPTPSPLTGLECNGCANLEMREEQHMGTRKRFFWRCTKGHEVLEGRNYGERVTLAPPECEEAGSFVQWKAGAR